MISRPRAYAIFAIFLFLNAMDGDELSPGVRDLRDFLDLLIFDKSSNRLIDADHQVL